MNDDALRTATEQSSAGHQAICVTYDVADVAMVERTVATFGRLDVVS
jgi:NAD(P)-dependent dehydrogenase (short-subunit alcohol dehydrogenase family)